MKRRMTLATVSLAMVLVGTLSGCTGEDEAPPLDDPLASATPPAEPSPVPSVDSSTDASIALRGEWADEELTYIIKFHEDGTFTVDRDGVPNVRVGTYEVENNVVKMYGTDGKTVEGAVSDDAVTVDNIELKKL